MNFPYQCSVPELGHVGHSEILGQTPENVWGVALLIELIKNCYLL